MSAASRIAVLEGIGAWLPPRVVTNDDLSLRFDTSDEWIRTRTGIRRRHVVGAGVSTGMMAAQAGARALKSAGATGADALVLATTTPDRPCPATAPTVAAALGLGPVPAFDVAAVCSGFLYALATAAGLIAAGTADRVLVIASEAFTTILDPADRATVCVFGDGAGAAVLRAGRIEEPGAFGPAVLHSDGALADLITVRAGGAEQRSSGRAPAPGDEYFSMRGQEVFTKAVLHMADASRTAARRAGWEPAEVDWLVGHQANLRILRSVADQLDLPEDRLVVHLDEVGNTAAASIPLALAQAHSRREFQPGQRLVLAAFGGGATWGATTLRWPALAPIDL